MIEESLLLNMHIIKKLKGLSLYPYVNP